MSAPRISSELWVSALKKQLEMRAIPIFIIRKGDRIGGAILIKISDLRGSAKLLIQAPNVDSERKWIELESGIESKIDEKIEKQKKVDNDLWVLEIEDINADGFLNDFLLSI